MTPDEFFTKRRLGMLRWRVARWLGRNTKDADVQDITYRTAGMATKQWASCVPGHNGYINWVYTILRNQTNAYLRSIYCTLGPVNQVRLVGLEDDHAIIASSMCNGAYEKTSAYLAHNCQRGVLSNSDDSMMELRDALGVVGRCLSPLQFEILQYKLAGYSHRATADFMGIPLGSVFSGFREVCRKLRRLHKAGKI